MNESSLVLVLDGHDGSGKTTLARRLAESLGGAHAQPYSGIVGQQLFCLIERHNFQEANRLAQQAVNRAIANADSPVVICDRHWMTAFSILPETYWSGWEWLPPTTLCWTDLETTISRLEDRLDQDAQQYDHGHFLSIYWELGQRFRSHVLRTDTLTLDESFAQLFSWATHFVGQT